MSDPQEFDKSSIHDVSDEYATYGDNPRKEQVRRAKAIVSRLELCQEDTARMGAIYKEFGNEEHSQYCVSIYGLLEIAKETVLSFLTNM